MKRRIDLLLLLLLFIPSDSFGQATDFRYQRTIAANEAIWGAFHIPDEMYERLLPDFQGFRIYSIQPAQDTIEVPFFLQILSRATNTTAVPLEMMNEGFNGQFQTLTLSLQNPSTIDRILLDIADANFDIEVDIEGSMDQKNWMAISKRNRLLAISNKDQNYRFTNLTFTNQNYNHYRLQFATTKKLNVSGARIYQALPSEGTYTSYDIVAQNTIEDKKKKSTIIDLALSHKVPISFVHFNVLDSLSYYRKFHCQYLADSIQTPTGKQPHYITFHSGLLTSRIAMPDITSLVYSKALRIIIENEDNPPLQIEKISVKGPVHRVVMRSDQKGDKILLYGATTLSKPEYDIAHFNQEIPENLNILALGSEQSQGMSSDVIAPSYTPNKIWIYIIMGIIALILGWVSIRSLRQPMANSEE